MKQFHVHSAVFLRVHLVFLVLMLRQYYINLLQVFNLDIAGLWTRLSHTYIYKSNSKLYTNMKKMDKGNFL